MPYKNEEYNKQCKHNWYLDNKQRVYDNMNNRRKELKKWYNNYKENATCDICGKKGKGTPEIIVFHHIGNKEKGISRLVCNGASKERILEEISKCQVLCANCHRKIHTPIVPNFRNQSTKKWFVEFKLNLKCERCGENDVRCLDFHHTGDKNIDIADLIADNCSVYTLQKELYSCECLCANCHRTEHAKCRCVGN